MTLTTPPPASVAFRGRTPAPSGTPARFGTAAPTARFRLGSLAWQGTRLEGDAVETAAAHVMDDLVGRGVMPDSTVVLESDDSGRTVLALLALAGLRCSVVLVDRLDRAFDGSTARFAAASAIVLRAVDAQEAGQETGSPAPLDLRAVLTAVERGRHPQSPVSVPQWETWFRSPRALGVFSSGTTTGQPTLVWKSGAGLAENALATARSLDYSGDDVLLPLLPLSGQYGSSCVLIAWVLGAGLVTSRRHRPGEALRMIQRCAVTAVDAPPLVYRAMIDELRRRPGTAEALSGVRLFGVGGEGVSELLLRDFHAETGRGLVDGYGLTQLGNVAFAEPAVPGAPTDPLPVQRVLRPVDTFQVSVVDDEGVPVLDGVPGRILVGRTDRTPVVGDDLWFDTGDVGHGDSGGLVVAGRTGMAMRNGTVIPFAWIEATLARAGIEAYAVAAAGATSTRIWLMVHDPLHRSRDHWQARILPLIDPELQPDVVQVVGQVPVDESGKVSRRRLQALAAGLQRGRGRQRRDRMSALGRLRSTVLAHRQELMHLIQELSDLPTAQHDFRAMLNVLDMAEGELSLHTTPESIPVDVFMARNAILESFAIYCLVPSLWARRIRVRPATGTEKVVERLVELLQDGCPAPLAFHREPQQDFVRRVAAEPSVVLFTGHRSNAEDVLAQLTGRHVFLYFGRGVNPVVVFPDAGLERASKEIVYSRLYNGGQDCLAPDIVLVHEDVAEELEALLTRDAAEYVTANGGRLAPLAKDSDLLGAVAYLTAHAGGLVSGGGLRFEHRTFDPAVVRVTGQARSRPHEHFAPILSTATFADTDEVLGLLHSEHYRENGFGTAVYGGTESFARAMTDIGLVAWGQSLVAAIPPFEPFGGNGVESGFIHHRGRRTLGPINITQAAVRFGASLKAGDQA